ncbi:MAG: hypothetical protein V4478_00080 [Patescibacteria group bacterium]
MRYDIETVKVHYALVSEQTLNAIISQFVNKRINWENPGIDGEVIIELQNDKKKKIYRLNEDNPILILSNCFTAITIPDEWDDTFIKLAESFN